MFKLEKCDFLQKFYQKSAKNEVAKIFKESGLDTTDSIYLFLRTTIREHGDLFKANLDVPNKDSKVVIEEEKRCQIILMLKNFLQLKN